MFKRGPPIAAAPGGFSDFRAWFFVCKDDDVWILPVGFGLWVRLLSIGNGCGLHMYGFSPQLDPDGLILIFWV